MKCLHVSGMEILSTVLMLYKIKALHVDRGRCHSISVNVVQCNLDQRANALPSTRSPVDRGYPCGFGRAATVVPSRSGHIWNQCTRTRAPPAVNLACGYTVHYGQGHHEMRVCM